MARSLSVLLKKFMNKSILLLLSILILFLSSVHTQKLNGVLLDYVDKNISPCNNFYQYSSGKWLDTACLPEGKLRYGFLNDKDLEVSMRIIKMFDSFQDSNLELNVSEKDAFSKLYLSGLNQTSEWKNDLVDIQIQKIRKINSLNDLSAKRLPGLKGLNEIISRV